MRISPSLSIDSPCEEALQLTKKHLAEAGLRPVQTFDLHGAQLTQNGCTCPNHGTDHCDCQLTVLLVYGDVAEPATLILHGNDGRTWISVTDNPLHRSDEKLLARIRHALENQLRAGASAKSPIDRYDILLWELPDKLPTISRK